MSNNLKPLINIRLQPCAGGMPVVEPFQRLADSDKTVETVWKCLLDCHRTEARC